MFCFKRNYFVFTLFMWVMSCFLTKTDSKRFPPTTFEVSDDVLKTYSAKEIACFAKDMVLFNGSCEPLESYDVCPPGKWLMLKTVEGNGKFVAECKHNCPFGEFWWPSNNTCIKDSVILQKYCKGKDVVWHDEFGNANCHCYTGYGSLQNSNNCYEFYQRGPCEIDEVVTFNASNGYAVCSKDLCLEQNSRVPGKKLYGPFKGIGKCYKFGHLDMCYDQYAVDDDSKVPDCIEPPSGEGGVVDGAPLCKVDKTTGKCRKEEFLNLNVEKDKPYAKAFLCHTLRDRNTGKPLHKGC